jgi:hypothetical protein
MRRKHEESANRDGLEYEHPLYFRQTSSDVKMERWARRRAHLLFKRRRSSLEDTDL